MHLFQSSSTQLVIATHEDELLERRLPSAEERVEGHRLEWGRVEVIGSPAYWSAQAWIWELDEPDHYRLGRSLHEEVLACLLGGYGTPAEVGLAAYDRLRALPSDEVRDADRVREALHAPLAVAGRQVRYRFANQKSAYVAAAMQAVDGMTTECDDLCLRDALTDLPGIGLKTASWVVRNWRGSDEVSILDVHIIRVARGLGLFDDGWRVERDYRRMEQAYLAFCKAIGARASILDSVMWMTVRQLPPSILVTLATPPASKAEPNRRGKIDRSQFQLI